MRLIPLLQNFSEFCSLGLGRIINSKSNGDLFVVKGLEVSVFKDKNCLDAKWPVLVYKILIFWKFVIFTVLNELLCV